MQGLRNEDGLHDLRGRLELIPADLEQYVAQMMSTLDSSYLEQAAQLFQVALHTDQAASLLTYSFLHEEDSDYAIKLKVEPLKTAEVCDRFISMERRLNSRCKGLLEVHDRKSEDLSSSRGVGFLHRTVRNFFRTSILRDILGGSSSEAFDVNLLLCKLFIAQIKSLSEISNQKYFLLLLNQFLLYAGNLEAERNESPTALLDELDRSAGILFADRTTCTLFTSPILSDDHWANHLHDGAAEHQGGGKNTFLAFTLIKCLRLYPKEKVIKEPQLVSTKQGRPLLDYVLRPSLRNETSFSPDSELLPDIELLDFVLTHGANPNASYARCTIWVHCLDFLHKSRKVVVARNIELWSRVTQLLMQHGAQSSTQMDVNSIDIIRSIFDPSDAQKFEKMLQANNKSGRRGTRFIETLYHLFVLIYEIVDDPSTFHVF